MSTFKPRVWDNYEDVTAYAKRTAKFENKVVEVLSVPYGWVISNHYSHVNGGYPDWYYEEKAEQDKYEQHRLECIIAAEAQTDEEKDTIMDGWKQATAYD